MVSPVKEATAVSTVPVSRYQPLHALLETLERRELAPLEARVLLCLSGREGLFPDLADALGVRPAAIRHAVRCLSMRGLIRRRFERGSRFRFVLSVTAAGLLIVEALTEALDSTGSADGAHPSDSRLELTPSKPRWGARSSDAGSDAPDG